MRCSCPQSQLRMSSAWQRALDGALSGNAQSLTSGAQEHHCLPLLICTAMRSREWCPENLSSACLTALCVCCWTFGLILLALACRRRIEHRLRGRVSDQLLWKGLKGASLTLPPEQADT